MERYQKFVIERCQYGISSNNRCMSNKHILLMSTGYCIICGKTSVSL